MKLLKTVVFFLSISVSVMAQPIEIIDNQVAHFQLKDKNNDIDFLVFDTVFNIKKPILLYCQGSTPVPLCIDYGTNVRFGAGVSGFDIPNIQKQYHLVVISKPETPIKVPVYQLNKNNQYITDKSDEHSFKESFLRANYLENYVDRANKVIQYLLQQSWVDNNKVVVFGHSEGVHVASAIAATNNAVTCLGLGGANIFGRIDEMLRLERKRAETKDITWEMAEQNMNFWYQLWENANNPDSVAEHPDLLSWKSFSRPTFEDLLKVDIPIYVVYGTNDITAELCDLLPLIFINHGKKNLTMKRYFGFDHSFNLFDENSNLKESSWTEMMNAFVAWSLECDNYIKK